MLRQEWSSRREKNRQFQRQLAVAGQNLNPVRVRRRLLGEGPGHGNGALAIAKAVDGGIDQRQLQLGCGLAPKRSSCITLVQAETKSATNRSEASLWA
jgi:hypothetical protein